MRKHFVRISFRQSEWFSESFRLAFTPDGSERLDCQLVVL